MKKKSEIRLMLKEYEVSLENIKTDIAGVAMNRDLEFEEKNKQLSKIEPVYQSYVSVVDVLRDILEVGLEDKQDQEDGSETEDEIE